METLIEELLPAPAGMIPVSGVLIFFFFSSPRTRGDDPDCDELVDDLKAFSPHPRG